MSVIMTIENEVSLVGVDHVRNDTYIHILTDEQYVGLMFVLGLVATNENRYYALKIKAALNTLQDTGFPRGWIQFGVSASEFNVILERLDSFLETAMMREDRIAWIFTP
jgi:hypothetical protein